MHLDYYLIFFLNFRKTTPTNIQEVLDKSVPEPTSVIPESSEIHTACSCHSRNTHRHNDNKHNVLKENKERKKDDDDEDISDDEGTFL